MMKIIKKICAGFLIVSFAASLCGCAFSDDIKTISDSDTIVLTVYDENVADASVMSGWFAQILKEKFNVELQFLSANDRGFNSYVAQNTLGDIIVFSDMTHYRTARDAGCLFDWESYGFLDTFGDFLTEYAAESLEKNRSENGGTIYGIYTDINLSGSSHSTPAAVYLNFDLYEKLGYPSCQTLEDLTEILQDMAQLAYEDTYQTVYAVSADSSEDDAMMDLALKTAALYGYEAFGVGLFNPSTGSYEECIDPDGIYVRILKFYNTLYRLGLFDPSSASQSASAAAQKYTAGYAVMSLSETDGFIPFEADDFTPLCYQDNIYGDGSILAIASNCEYPDVCIQIINWLYQPEGALTYLYGPQGVCWDYDENMNPYLTDFCYECFENMYLEMPEESDYTGTYLDGFCNLYINTWNINSEIVGLDGTGITYECLTWPSVQDSAWYQSNYQSNDSAWYAYTGCHSAAEYLEQSAYLEVPATTYTMSDMETEESIPYTQISYVICSCSWEAVYASDDEAFRSAIQKMSDLAQAYRYDILTAFFEKELEVYKDALGF